MIPVISYPSPNFDSRNDTPVSILVLHYTGMATGPAALDWLCNPLSKVSSHYLIEEDGRIFQLVEEANRAWHAGVSWWGGKAALNSDSIGIEIVNPGHEFGYREFPAAQMRSVARLSREIIERHNILARNVVGHSDIAPSRKVDPGELFNWEELAAQGIGQSIPHLDVNPYESQFWTGDSGPEVLRLQQSLRAYGYGIELTGLYDTQTEVTVSAFQRHFRRAMVTGIADAETRAVLDVLIAA